MLIINYVIFFFYCSVNLLNNYLVYAFYSITKDIRLCDMLFNESWLSYTLFTKKQQLLNISYLIYMKLLKFCIKLIIVKMLSID